MNCIIPFESKVKFKSPVKEICSISLEHEITKNDSEILGNFFVSGTYKEHELSVNTTDFKFTIPFSVELTNRIDYETLDFSIDNFTYEIEGDELLVKIDYVVDAEDVREEPSIIVNEEITDPMDLIEENERTEAKEEVDLDESLQDAEEIIDPKELPEANILENEYIRESVNPEIVSLVQTDDDYMTYHIHIVKECETVESIAMEYKLDKDEILKLNNITELNANDKLLIPLINE